MKKTKIINFVVYLLIVLGIIFFINLKTDNSLASIYKVFNPCEPGSINNCSQIELKELIKNSLNEN